MRSFAPQVSGITLVRLATATVIAAGFAIATIEAQIPGRNVNMVSGVGLPAGDPFLQRQNEGTMAASTRNPLHLLGGSNDYRTVDIPNPIDGGLENGDAWVSMYKSGDGGRRWTSTLLPGYPQEPAGEGLDAKGQKSPLKTAGYAAAADPVVRAGTSGLFYYSGLAFDRGANGKSAIFMARFIDNNNREDRDAIQYLNTNLVASSTGADGRFLDKPWLAVDIPRGNPAPTCRIETPGDRNVLPGGAVTQDPPVVQVISAGTVYVAYTSFFGPSDSRSSEILLTRSFDCGVTWQAPMRVSRLEDPINQGATIAIDPKNGHLFVSWRRFTKPGSTIVMDAVMMARLPSGGNKFDPPGVARRFPNGKKIGLQPERFSAKKTEVVEELTEFDQATGPFQFRTNAYPTLAVDGDGRVYLAWSERGFATFRSSPVSGDARVVMVTTTDGANFTAPRAIDNARADNDPTVTELVGHQVMPSLAFSGGKLMVAYYDLRETKSTIYGPQISDQNILIRNTIDIRAAMAGPGAVPVFAPSVKVSEYLMGFHPSLGPGKKQLQFNPPNLPMFKQGTVPFMGDYIDLAPAPSFVRGSTGRWVFNTAATPTLPAFHAIWTDNRDVRAPADHNWTVYGPPASAAVTGTSGVCVPGNAGSRNQNVYTSRIAGGLHVGSPSNTKPLSTTVQRGFVVFAQNATALTRSFRMTILNQPAGGRASFDQFPVPPYTASSPAPRITIDLSVPPRSTAARTVYVTSTDVHAQISVDVSEIAAIGGAEVPGGLEGLIILNPDVENPDIENPDVENPDVENPDIENAEVYNPDVENPDVENPDIENPDVENPDIENPDVENPDVENPDIENILVANPDVENPDVENPDVENPDVENPDIENPDIENVAIGGDGVLTDITWNVTNTGNTTSAFNVNLFLANATTPTGLKTQLILHKTYRTPVVKPGTCQLAYESHNIVLANIPRPTFIRPTDNGVPDQNDPSDKNATLWLGPGETGKITLRVYDAIKADNDVFINENGETVSVDRAFNPRTSVTPAVSSQAVATEAVALGETDPPLVTPTGSNLFFLQMPVNGVTGVPLAPAVRVQVRDNQTGTPVPGAQVTLTFGSNPGLAVLSGNIAVADATGIATFPALTVSTPGLGYTLVATATTGGVMAVAESTPFNIFAPLVITTTALDGGTAGVFYSQTLQSSGGAGAMRTWSLVNGALPQGLALVPSTGLISGTIDPFARGSFDVTVQVVDGEVPPHVATRALSILVGAMADVAITMSDAPDPIVAGNDLTYTIAVTNAGPSAATSVIVTDALPASVTFVSAGPGCSPPSGGLVNCAAGSLGVGATAFITVVVKPNVAGTLDNTAGVAASEPDPVANNNLTTASTTVESPVPPLVLVNATLLDAFAGSPYPPSPQALQVTGGQAPYTFAVDPAAKADHDGDGQLEPAILPPGLSLGAGTGIISGTPTTVGNYAFRVIVTDAAGRIAATNFCIHVDQNLTANLLTTNLSQGGDADTLAAGLVDPDEAGVSITAATATGALAAIGSFTGGGSASLGVGFDRGLVLSSGAIGGAAGPNSTSAQSTVLGTAGDEDLRQLAVSPASLNPVSRDAAILEFNFTPTCAVGTTTCNVTFEYVLGSDEYHEYANTTFNDVFGFFLTDVTAGGVKKNYALLPGVSPETPVSINTVNGGNPLGTNAQHPEFFRSNRTATNVAGPYNLQADGLTKPLQFNAPVISGNTYHIKIGISDISDSAFDSWVFIKNGSFKVTHVCPIIVQ